MAAKSTLIPDLERRKNLIDTLYHHSDLSGEAVCLCPLDGIIGTKGKKWGLLIVNEIDNHGKLRFNELMAELKGISPSTLASTLKKLEMEELIDKETFSEIPPRVEYSLSARGKELREAIIPLIKWATKKGNFTVHCGCSLIKK